MNVLWAPWRMSYILSDKKESACIFCPGGDRSRDEERLILYVGSMTMVVMNMFPYNNGHLLVAPVRHVSGLEELSEAEIMDVMAMVQKTIGILREVMNPEGFALLSYDAVVLIDFASFMSFDFIWFDLVNIYSNLPLVNPELLVIRNF